MKFLMALVLCASTSLSTSAFALYEDGYDRDNTAAECKAKTLKQAAGLSLSEALDIHNACMLENLPTAEQIRDLDQESERCDSAPDGCYP